MIMDIFTMIYQIEIIHIVSQASNLICLKISSLIYIYIYSILLLTKIIKTVANFMSYG